MVVAVGVAPLVPVALPVGGCGSCSPPLPVDPEAAAALVVGRVGLAMATPYLSVLPELAADRHQGSVPSIPQREGGARLGGTGRKARGGLP